MKRLLLFLVLALGAAGCGGVKSGDSADGGPDGDHRADGGGPDDGTDGGESGSCVLGTSQLGSCNL